MCIHIIYIYTGICSHTPILHMQAHMHAHSYLYKHIHAHPYCQSALAYRGHCRSAILVLVRGISTASSTEMKLEEFDFLICQHFIFPASRRGLWPPGWQI